MCVLSGFIAQKRKKSELNAKETKTLLRNTGYDFKEEPNPAVLRPLPDKRSLVVPETLTGAKQLEQ
jgi:hypothetical protein